MKICKTPSAYTGKEIRSDAKLNLYKKRAKFHYACDKEINTTKKKEND